MIREVRRKKERSITFPADRIAAPAGVPPVPSYTLRLWPSVVTNVELSVSPVLMLSAPWYCRCSVVIAQWQCLLFWATRFRNFIVLRPGPPVQLVQYDTAGRKALGV